jgi:hypothetical protein
MWVAFAVCALMVTTTVLQAMVLFVGAAGLIAFVLANDALGALGILLPTLIHVSLFTLVFMALGALRSGQRVQWMLIAMYLAAIALILVAPPTAAMLVPSFAKAANDYFALVAPALGRLFGIAGLTLDNRMVGLLAFVYTYHYLNWFIKAEVIRWADISRVRLAIVAAASAASTALYFYDYAYGFSVLLAFSLAHIVLEFPLNSLALRQLAEAIRQRIAKTAQQRA